MNRKIKQLASILSGLSILIGSVGSAYASTNSYPSYRFTKINDVNNGWSNGTSSATDSSNNTYTLSIWNGTVKFNPGDNSSSITPSAGNNNNTATCALTKYDSTGAYQWTKIVDYLDSANDLSICVSLTVGSNGVVYVGGWGQGTITFDGISGTHSYTEPYDNSGFSFVNEYKTDGSYLKTLMLPAGDINSYNQINSISVDSNNNLLIGGQAEGYVTFDGTNYNTYNRTTAYTVKYNEQGEYQWINLPNVSPYSQYYTQYVTTDKSGNTYSCGQYDYSGGISSYSVFVEKIASDGSESWVKSIIAENNQQVGCNTLAVDNSGNVYAGGNFRGSTTFDGVGGAHVIVNNAGDYSGYILKLGSDGSYQWTKVNILGGAGDYTAVDSLVIFNNELYVVGVFEGNVQFNQNDINSVLSSPIKYNAYFSGYGLDGSYKFTKSTDNTYDSNTNLQYVNASVDNLGNLYIVGTGHGTPVFDGPGGIDRQQIGDGMGVSSTITSSFQLADYPTTPKTPNTGAGMDKLIDSKSVSIMLSILLVGVSVVLISRHVLVNKSKS